MSSSRRWSSPARRALTAVAVLAAVLAVPACAFRETSIEAGRTHLTSVATANYDFSGGSHLDRLYDLLDRGPEGAVDAAGPALELDLALMREIEDVDGRRVLQPIRDGDVLLDGYARPGEGDGLKLRVQVDRPCHLYVIQVDATARPTRLFPNAGWSTVSNPIQAGRPYRLPEGNVLFPLGPSRGIETLYVVATEEPFTELEALLEEHVAAPWREHEAPAIVERALCIDRGIAGDRRSEANAVVAPSGALSDVESRKYVGRPGRHLVVTRWFRHE